MKSLLISSFLASIAFLGGCSSTTERKENSVPKPTGEAKVVLPNAAAIASTPEAVESAPKVNPNQIKILKADSASYYGKTSTFNTLASISDYFNYAYRGTEGTHYSFRLKDGNSSYITAYAPRTKFKDLFENLVENGGENIVEVTITTDDKHGSNSIWTMTDWKPAT